MTQLGISMLDEVVVEEMASWPPRECPFALRCTREDRSLRQWRGAVCMCACVCVSDMSDEASARAAFRAALCDIPTSMSVKWESDPECPSSDICT